MNTLYNFEVNIMRDRKIKLICGIDEVGRGPLAGPVYACACIPSYDELIEGINDSKKVSSKKREILYDSLVNSVICYKTISISPQEIDTINILNATKTAMNLALEYMFPLPELVLVDAVSLNTRLNCESIIKGDAKCYSIACASIIAKVERDRLMEKYANIYPEYGFEDNKGYGTAHHIEMLKKYGPCEIHRKSFIQNFINC